MRVATVLTSSSSAHLSPLRKPLTPGPPPCLRVLPATARPTGPAEQSQYETQFISAHGSAGRREAQHLNLPLRLLKALARIREGNHFVARIWQSAGGVLIPSPAMNTLPQSLVSLGYICGNFDMPVADVAAYLASHGVQPVLQLNGLALYDGAIVVRAIVAVRWPYLLEKPAMPMIHGEPTGPVEFCDEPDPEGDDDEPGDEPTDDHGGDSSSEADHSSEPDLFAPIMRGGIDVNLINRFL